MEDTLPQCLRQSREGVRRRVKVPVGIVAGEHQEVLGVKHGEHLEQLGIVVRPLEWLAGKADVIPQVG